MQFQAIDAQLEFLAWRDTQLAEISLQLENSFPSLLDDLTSQVERAGRFNLIRSSVSLKSSTEAAIQLWAANELNVALSRAEAELDQVILQLPSRVNLDTDVWVQLTNALPALAGVGLIGASVAAIPAVISFATIVTPATSFLIFWGAAATSTISWPLFALGAAGIGVATIAGSQSLEAAENRARRKLCSRIHKEASRQVFGIGEEPGARCILSDIQAAVVKAGQNRIQGVCR